SHMPMPLVRLAPSNELVMIELQGSLEIDDADPKGGQALAKIEFHPGREDRPTLLISHHRLEGKIVSLTKPMAVLEKKQRSATNGEAAPLISLNGDRGDVPSSPTPIPLDSNDLDQPNSPTISRKRVCNGTDEERQCTSLDIPSSSPIPMKRIQGSEVDYSSPLPASKRRATGAGQTATYMEVVCIIRKKLLFSKRPEPVVRL
ncbi:uncharacterized protein FA14DRAFT_104964, partial [Meira miltonrushii]